MVGGSARSAAKKSLKAGYIIEVSTTLAYSTIHEQELCAARHILREFVGWLESGH